MCRGLEVEFQKQYPYIYEHLLTYKDKLSRRNKAETGIRYEWYALQRCAATYYKEFEKEKIVYPDISQKLSFALSKPNEFFNNTVYFIANNLDLYFQLSILNSTIIDWYYKQISAQLGERAVRMFSVFFQHLPIPKISSEEQRPFEVMVDCVLYAKENGLEKEAKTFESVIDAMVYDLYFEDEMKKANCYITERIKEKIEPFRENDTDSFKTDYIKSLHDFCNEDQTISRALTARSGIDIVKIIEGKNNE